MIRPIEEQNHIKFDSGERQCNCSVKLQADKLHR